MKSLFLVLSVLAPLSALAHVEPGTYTGRTAEGLECQMTAGENFFVDDKPHPLNERIRLATSGVNFVVNHPVVIDSSKDLVTFNHDLFQGVVATPTGAQMLEVAMSHAAGKEGPVSFVFVENFWKTGKKAALRCGNLVHSR